MKGAIEMELLQQQEVCKLLRCCRNTYYRMLKTTDIILFEVISDEITSKLLLGAFTALLLCSAAGQQG